MALAAETVALRFIDVAAATPIDVAMATFEASDIQVVYGKAANLAVLNVDYTITLAADFESFVLTPLPSLLTKINALIAADATETNYITVRRELDLLTEATPDGVRYTPFTSREFDRTAMRFQQLREGQSRSVRLSGKFAAPYPSLEISEWEAGKALVWGPSGEILPAAVGEADIAVSVAAAAASQVAAAQSEIDAAAAADRAEASIGDNLVGQYDAPAPNLPCAVVKVGDETHLYSPLSVAGAWALDVLEADTTACKRPTTRKIVSLADVYHEIFDGFTRSGTFTPVPNSAALGGTYAGSTATGAYVEKQITLTGASTQVRLVYGTRNSCNHISVTINGGTSLVNMLPVNGSGEKFIDAYSDDTSPVVNNDALVATLPAGTYTFRFTCSTQKNASAVAGNRMYPQGIRVIGGDAGLPYGARTHAPAWSNGEAVLTTWQRWYNGVTYRATGGGTTSGTSPLDDTGVTWAVVDDTYALLDETYQDDVSEPMWAAWWAVNGQPEEDFGADIHGGVILEDETVDVDGLPVTLIDYQPVYGSDISVVQNARAEHTATPGVKALDIQLWYGARPGGDFPYRNYQVPSFNAFLGLYYSGMLPLRHYNVGEGFVYQLRRCLIQGAVAAKPSDYYGQSNPRYGRNKALQLLGLVEIDSPKGSSGIPATPYDGKFFAAVSLEMTRDSMFGFLESNGETYWDMNTSGVDVSAGGYTGMVCKGYFNALDGSVKKAVSAGQVIEARGTYRVRLHRGSIGDP